MDGTKNLSVAQQTTAARNSYHRRMEAIADPHISAVDRLLGGVLVTFDDGRDALYSPALLQRIVPQAIDIAELLEGPEPQPGLF